MAILDRASIRYQAESKLLSLMVELASVRKLKTKKDKFAQAAKIRYFLKTIERSATYLSEQELEAIYQCLITTAEITSYPIAPVINTTTQPDVLVGETGPAGVDGADSSVQFYIGGIGSGTKTADVVPLSTTNGVRWDFILTDGTNYQAGVVIAVHDGSSVEYDISTTFAIGTISSIFIVVVVNGSSLELRCGNIAPGNFEIKGKRYTIYE